MLTKYIPKNIQEKLKAKERALERANKSDPPQDGYMSFKSMASRTIFVRMCSNKVNAVDNKMIDGGYNNNLERKPFGFGSIYRYSSLTDGDEFGPRPVAGIKSIEVQYKGGFKAIRECTVSWVVPSLDDLEIFQDHFFTVGKTVVVDWGWVYSDSNIDVQLADSFITRVAPPGERPRFEVKQSVFTNPQTIISSMNGDYDAIGGQITNFEISLRNDGGFDCTTKIISMGASLFKRPIDVGGNQAGLKLKGKEVREQPPDSIINCVLNLQQIILQSSFGVNINNLSGQDGVINNTNVSSLVKSTSSMPKYGYKKDLHNIYDDDEGSYHMNVDDTNNPQVLWITTGDTSNFFVTWGWMEDNIISRYTSFVGGSGEDRDVKMTMRSLEPVLDKAGNPIPLSKVDNSFDSRINELKGDDFVNFELTNIAEEARSNILKESVKIRKPDFLPPVNPFKFFISNFPVEYADNIGPLTYTAPFNKAFLTVGSRENFPKFAESDEDRFGSLRNVWVNIKEIQTAFGIKEPKSNDTSTNNINPPGTLDVAINNLLTALNTNFHDVWNFELATDFYDPTNIKVVDTSDSEEENPQYTKYQDNSHLVASADGDNKSGLGVFQFPSFKRGSIVKNQTLNFKIPDAQALTILYGSNKKSGDSEQEFINGQIQKIFEIKKDGKKDRFLADLESSKYSSTGNDSLETNIGSVGTKPYSKVGHGEGYGIQINPKLWKKWWKIWKPDSENSEDAPEKTDEGFLSGFFSFFSKGYLEIQENEKTKKPEVVKIKPNSVKPIKKYYVMKDKKPILRSDVQKVLKSYLNSSSPIAQFDTSNLVPAELGLEIDGTGGITPFDLIHTEYIQGIYKSDITIENFVMSEQEVVDQNSAASEAGRSVSVDPDFAGETVDDRERVTDEQQETTSTRIGPLTFFQVTDVKHTLDESGWKTELTSKMRINRIQRFDKISGLNVQTDRLDTSYETRSIPVETLQEDIEGDETLENLDYEDYPEFDEPPIPKNLVLDTNISPTLLEKEVERVAENTPPDDENTFVMPGTINSGGNPPGEIVTDMSPANVQGAIRAREEGKTVLNADLTPFDFDALQPDAPPIKKSSPVASKKMPETNKPVPEKIERKELTETKTHIIVHKTPTLTNEVGIVRKVTRNIVDDIASDPEDLYALLNPKTWEAPVEATIEATEPVKEEKLSESIVVETPVTEPLVVLKSTYDPSWPDWATNPTYKLIYKIVPGWYTKSNNNPKNISFYGEPPTAAVAKRFRQKFWDEVIETPNETGKTALDTKEAIDAKLAEIGDTYKNLGPYDTWSVTTGIDYASYNPTTGKADYTPNGVKIVLPTGAN